MSKFSTEEKVRIVLDGMRYPEGITGLCWEGLSHGALIITVKGHYCRRVERGLSYGEMENLTLKERN